MEKNHKLTINDIVSLCLIGLIAIAVIYQIIITKQNNDLVGKQIVVGTDTLRVTSYRDHDNVYHLSNGAVVDKKYIKKTLLKHD